jgi:hypothetical protein
MAGRYGVAANQTACLACPPGTISTPEYVEFDECVPCAGGWFDWSACPECASSSAPRPGKTACGECAAGRYSAIEAASNCVDCAPGTYTVGAKTVRCTPCAPGTFASDAGRGGECTATCDGEAGWFSGAGATACVYCSGGVVALDACVGCGLGRYRSDDTGSCRACPPGKAQTRTAFANSSALCVRCEGAAFAANDSASCIQAAEGYAPNANGTGQTPCGVGTFRGAYQYACTPCADGLQSLGQAATTCAPCEAGKYRRGSLMRACLECSEGGIAASAGASACEACPPGTAPSPDRTACVECLAGYVSLEGTRCVPCVGGLTSAPGASECVHCPDWTVYIDVGVCGPCAPGQYMVRSNVDFAYACIKCPRGTYNPRAGGRNQSACLRGPCDPPSYVPNADEGATGCAPCPQGSASADGVTCAPCPAGSYGLRGEACALCPPGNWTAASGQTACEACAAGTFATEMGAKACTPCPPGTAGEGCAPCAVGEFMPDAGAVACRERTTRCPPGHIVVPREDRPTEDNACRACTGCDADQYALLATPQMSTWDTFTLLISLDGVARVVVPNETCPGNTTYMGYTCLDNHFTPGMYLKGQETTAGAGGGDGNAPINLDVMRCTHLSERGCLANAERMDYVVGGAFDCFVGCRYGLNADAVSAYAKQYGVASTESLEGNVFLARRAVCFDPPLCAPCPTEVCAVPGRYRPGCGPSCLLTPDQCRDPDTGRFNYGCNASCAPPPANAYHITGGAQDAQGCPFACHGSPNGLDPGYHLSDDGTRCELCGVCADPQSVPMEPCRVYNRTAEVCRPCPIVEGGMPRSMQQTSGRCAYSCQTGYYASEDASTCLRCTALNDVPCPVGTFRDVAACRPDRPPPCTPCAAPADLLMGNQTTAAADRAAMLTFASAGATADGCNATCGAGFHTLRRSTGAYWSAPLPLWDLRCALCGFNDDVPCHGRCANGQYRDLAVPSDNLPGACKPCRVSARDCPMGQYAPLCSGNHTGNVACLPCAAPPAGKVIVPYDALRSAATLQRGLVAWDGVTCPTACAPNHVQASAACVPCRVQAGEQCAPPEVPGQPTPCDFVYAHWNATDGPMWWAPASTPLSLRGIAEGRRAGVCWACPTGTGTLDVSGTDLCQLLPGFGLANDAMDEVQRVPIPTEPGAVVRSLREPQPLADGFEATPQRQRRLLSIVVNNNASSSSTTALLLLAPVPIGTYNDGTSVRPISCPQGRSTRTKGSVSAAQCECMPGYYDRGAQQACVECPANTYRSVNMPSGECVPCADNETTFGRTAQSACACVAGWMRFFGAERRCAPCAGDRFCRPCHAGQKECPSNAGAWVVPCMPGGTSPPGSASLLNCTCARRGAARLLRPGYTLDAIAKARTPTNVGLYCLEPPPHTVYDNATLTLRCMDGWTPTYAAGVSPPLLQGCALCGRGRFSPSGAASHCRNCPLGTYMDRPDATGASPCTPCDLNQTTLVEGATSAEQCACPAGTRRNAQTQRCEGCALGQYATPDRTGCLPCPAGSTSRVGAANVSDCVCLPGTVRSDSPKMKQGCWPCPVGTFAAQAGQAACTPCGANRVTATTGAVASSACFCAEGYTAIAGVLCVNSSSLLLAPS